MWVRVLLLHFNETHYTLKYEKFKLELRKWYCIIFGYVYTIDFKDFVHIKGKVT
jgi:hypothetical protein